MPVGVAYGTDPGRVMKLLIGVAESHPGVLLVCPPMRFLAGWQLRPAAEVAGLAPRDTETALPHSLQKHVRS